MKTEARAPSDAPSAIRASPSPPSRLSRFVRYWLPALLWMSLIFGFSTQAGSTRHTSRIIGPLLRWINPNVTDATINQVQYVIRKGAHMAEYAILAALLWRARRQPVRGDTRPWQWSEAGFALSLAIAFAASDEFHQSFVPSREGRVGDVFIDSAGAALGVGSLWLVGRWLRKW